ncbi:hypothetical protein JCM3263A_05090 [Thermobifida fusca]|jgi:hypothetical protein|uniref:CmpX n=2 Tax=Thermobifida fusca TaxID=2021 RepID=A0A9P2WRS9_THEFU|nr:MULTISPECIES: hypothetical protein [Thermobifida]AAZ54555.1 conserved hypothetical protein [Thermobifida fusca YX]EOR72394.1 hypothetical protein TM51_02948 [Thermobifida fusca TM51]MBO2529582.1 hypothetical protein [Thermobifida sp.]MDD6793285.1 hypothetical protein [Thermobifida fusca]PPS93400.1 CmpX [Thermobifida fusca]
MFTPLAVTDIGQGIGSVWGSLVAFIPRLAVFLVVLILGWLLAKLIGRLVAKALAKVGLDRALERGGLGSYFQRSRFNASDIAGKFVYYAGVLIVLQLAFSVFGPNNPITQMLNSVVAWLPHLAVALIIVVVAALIARAVRELASEALGGLSYGKVLANTAGVFIVGLGIIAALNQIGVAAAVTLPILIAVLAAVAGILIVGVGGGLIRPMQQRWEGWLDRAESETKNFRAQGAGDRGPATAGSRSTETVAPPRQESAPGEPLASSGERRRRHRRP